MPEVNYRIETESLNMSRVTRYSPETGILNSAIIHFPAGCEMLVEVFINHKMKQVLPTPVKGGTGGSVGVALDDTTQSFNINIPVKRDDPLEVLIYNHDEENSHTLTIVLLIEIKLEYSGP